MTDSSSNQKDPKLWAIAKERVEFKSHLFSFLIVNLMLWIIWFISIDHGEENSGVPWPIWPMLGWGIGIAFHYYEAYMSPKENSVEKEYEKLIRKQ